MANRFRVYALTITAVVVALVIANSVITLTTAHTAAMTIKSNLGDVPAYQVTSLGEWHGSLPIARTIITTTTVDLGANDYAANYGKEAMGGYIWGTGEVVVKPKASQMVVVHELGHALTYDTLVVYENGDMTAATMTLFGSVLDFNRQSDVSELPTALREVATEYQTVPADIYGSTYYTERLTEYLAQSFARYCSGQTVPPVVGEWLTELDGERF